MGDEPTDAPLGQEEIQGLAEKLERLDDVLSKRERAVILRLFDIASAAITDATSRSKSGAKLTDENEDPSRVKAQLSDNPKLSEGFLFYFGGPGKLPVGKAAMPILEPPPTDTLP